MKFNLTFVAIAALTVTTTVGSIAASIHHYSRHTKPRVGVSTKTIVTYLDGIASSDARIVYAVNLSDGTQRLCSNDPNTDQRTPIEFDRNASQYLCEFEAPLGIDIQSVNGGVTFAHGETAGLTRFNVIIQDEAPLHTYQEIRID